MYRGETCPAAAEAHRGHRSTTNAGHASVFCKTGDFPHIHEEIEMAEKLIIDSGNKEEKYRQLLPQLRRLLEDETDLVANLANLAAALRQTFGFFWVGFYLVKEGELVLGPFQGPIACTRIRRGRGVCGTAWQEERTIVVPDVELFPGHIACSSESRSEIVVPLFRQGSVIGVLDVDSDRLNEFDETDARYLQEICALLL